METKGITNLTIVYEEIKDDITYFVKLHRLSKAAGMSTEHVANLLEIANNDLPSIEHRYQKLQRNVNYLESKALDAGITLEDLKSQIQNANQSAIFLPLILSERGKKNAPVAQTEYETKHSSKTV